MTKVVVGVDGSTCAAQALRWATDLGRRRSWQVEAVLSCSTSVRHGIVHRHGDELDLGREGSGAALDRYLTEALGAEERKDVVRKVVIGTPAQGLLDAADVGDVALLVVGARGHGVVRRALLGAVSIEIVRRSSCPVAVVRGSELLHRDDRRRIVVGVDGSEPAQRALQWAIDEARQTVTELDVIHAWHPRDLGAESYSIVMTASTDAEKRAADLLSRSLAEADTGVLAKPPSPILVQGGAIASLMEASLGADLVVVGSRGLGPVAGPLLGSVSQHLAANADCPVVIVPPAPPAHANVRLPDAGT